MELSQLYAPDSDEEEPLWSAIFVDPDGDVIELRLRLGPESAVSLISRGPYVIYDRYLNRQTAMAREVIGGSTFAGREEGLAYFWRFVNDPDAGVMECDL